MSIPPCCDLKSEGDISKRHDMCPNTKCNCQKHISFNKHEFQLESTGFKNTMKNSFRGTEKMWHIFIKPVLKIATPFISADVAAETKNPQ